MHPGDVAVLLSDIYIATNLDLGALDLGVEPVVRGKGDRQKGSGDDTGYGGEGQRHRGARHLGYFISDVSLPRAFFLPRRLSVSFTSHSLSDLRAYYRLRGHPGGGGGRVATRSVLPLLQICVFSRIGGRRGESAWTALEDLGERAADSGGDSRKDEGGCEGEFGANPQGSRGGCERRPSGCVLRRDAHHTTISSGNGNDTNGPTRLEGKPEPAERARRENRTPGGDGLVASGRYITCVLPAAVLNAAPGTERGRSPRSEKETRYPIAGIPDASVSLTVV